MKKTMYFFYQLQPETSWILSLDIERDRVIAEQNPAFVTVLDLDNPFSENAQPSSDEIFKIKYRGPFYADFDAKDISESIEGFKAFMGKLRDLNIQLDQCKLFATGGKGFHIEVPFTCFNEKKAHKDVVMLPLIYKEIAQELYVPTLDLRVYSARRGRMWRTENVLRPNGKYKVRITEEEAEAMTPELYDEICSQPRTLPDPEPPTLSVNMALKFVVAKDTFTKRFSQRKNHVKTNDELRRKYNGEWPPVVLGILSGEKVKPGVGFNQLSTQLAITAHALGMTEEALITAAEGLCQNHVGDSFRYNTYSKRIGDIRRMYGYFADNPGYSYSAGAVRACCVSDLPEQDLDGFAEYESDETSQPDDEEGTEQKVAPTKARKSSPLDPKKFDATAGKTDVDDSITKGIRVTQNGIFLRKDGEYERISVLGLGQPVQLRTLVDEAVCSYELEVFENGVSIGVKELPIDRLLSKAAFQGWSMQKASASVQATDSQISALADLLRSTSITTGGHVYITGREGLDVIRVPVEKGKPPQTDIIWASHDQVLSRLGKNYRWKQNMDANGYRSDLHHAPMLENTAESREFFDHFFNINSARNVALMLGWYSAAFISQLIREVTEEFPFLHVYGPAGAGKSKTTDLLNKLFYYHTVPPKTQASGGTDYPLIAAVAGSASLPLILDEFKPRSMRKERVDLIRTTILNNNYTGVQIRRGTLRGSAGNRDVHVVSYANAAPIVLIGEGAETTTSLTHRMISVAITAETRGNGGDKTASYKHVFNNSHFLPKLGRSMLEIALYKTELKEIKRALDVSKEEITEKVLCATGSIDSYDRPIHNFAVVLLGLTFIGAVLDEVFDGRYTDRINELKDTVMSSIGKGANKGRTKQEASKVMSSLALMSCLEDHFSKLEEGVDYTVGPHHVDLHMNAVYNKYVRYQRTMGLESLYDNVDAFKAGMQSYPGLMTEHVLDNPTLRTDPNIDVYRFAHKYLDKEGVQYFRGRKEAMEDSSSTSQLKKE
jgi:hypothetical protein